MLEQSLTDILKNLIEDGRLRPARLVSLDQAHWKNWISLRLAKRDPVFANAGAHDDPETSVDVFERLLQMPLPSVVIERARAAAVELFQEVPSGTALTGGLRALLRLALILQARQVRTRLEAWLSADDLDADLAAALLIAFGTLSDDLDASDASLFRRWFEKDEHAAHAFVGLVRTGSWRSDDVTRLVSLAHAAARDGRNFALTPALGALFQALPLWAARDGLWSALENGTVFGDRDATWHELRRRLAHFGCSLPDADDMRALASRAHRPVAARTAPARTPTAWQAAQILAA